MLVCQLCGAVDNLLRCSKCKCAYYCSKEHQRQHWRRHKRECESLSVSPQHNSQGPHLTSPGTSSTATPAEIAASSFASTSYSGAVAPDLNYAYGAGPSEGAAGTSGYNANLPPVYYDLPTDSLLCDHGHTTWDSNLAGHHPLQHQQLASYFEEVPVRPHPSTEVGGNLYDAGGIGTDFDSLAFFLNGLGATPTSPTTTTTDPTLLDNSSYYTVASTSQQQPAMAAASSTSAQPPTIPLQEHNRLERLSYAQPSPLVHMPSPQSNEQRMYNISVQLIRDMDAHGICVIDNFAGMTGGGAVLEEVTAMYNGGAFTDGKVKSGGGSGQNVRGDKIVWVGGDELHCRNIGGLIRMVDTVVMNSNRTPGNGKLGNYNITDRTKAMVACYPGNGTQYVKHVDNPNKDGRCITSIYYLNHDWDVKKDGGLLRIFPRDCSMAVADIEPVFDRILFFWSDRRNPHEVQPALRTRYAITLWYYDKEERERNLRYDHASSSCQN